MINTFICGHALERYREHHPNATWADMKKALALGLPASTARVRDFIGWGWSDPDDVYVVSPDRRGVFVLARGNHVVTYLRLNTEAAQACAERWPMRKAA